MIAVLFVASIISFVLLRMAPGNPAREILGPVATPQAVAQLEDQMGLNKSIPQQYGIYVSHLLRGDFGISWQDREPVSKELGQRLPATIELALYAILLSIVLAIPIGVFAASHRRFDRVSRWGAVVGLGTPSFWLGLAAHPRVLHQAEDRPGAVRAPRPQRAATAPRDRPVHRRRPHRRTTGARSSTRSGI